MKLVILVDGSRRGFEEMIELVDIKKPLFIDTKNCDENFEYEYLINNIKKFSQSDNEFMLVNFSGKEGILKDLGDECSEMVLSISYNKNSEHYVEAPTKLFLELLNIFKKRD